MSRNAPRSPARAEPRPGLPRSRGIRAPRRQRGLVLVLVLSLVVAAALWGITSSFGTAAQRVDRDRATMAAIMQAKEALIARAALDVSRPGSLPCPDLTNNGNADTTCTPIAGPVPPNSRVGRLPWRTLGLPDLRDASGERLWYALSASLTDRTASQPINSDTQGEIQLTGLAPAQRVVAVIIAPGAPLNQNRTPLTAQINDVANYLEGENNYKLDLPGGVNNDVFQNSPPSGAFNDIVVPITEEELFSVVENMVALRLRKDIKPLIDTEYRDFWGAYPYPDSTFDPGKPLSPGFVGVASPPATEGHLPIDSTELAYDWATFDATVVQIAGGIPDVISGSTCSYSSPDWVCVITYTGTPTFRVSGVATNVARSFARYDTDGFKNDNCPQPPLPPGPCYINRPSVNVTGALVPSSPTGDASVVFEVQLDISTAPIATVRFRPPEASAVFRRAPVSPPASVEFFFANRWYELVYYATSTGALAGGVKACTPNPPTPASPCVLFGAASCPVTPPACVSRVRTDGTREDAGAMLVLAGRPMLVGAAVQAPRPNTDPTKYLEGATNPVTASPRVFEQKPRTPSFNDRVVVLTP